MLLHLRRRGTQVQALGVVAVRASVLRERLDVARVPRVGGVQLAGQWLRHGEQVGTTMHQVRRVGGERVRVGDEVGVDPGVHAEPPSMGLANRPLKRVVASPPPARWRWLPTASVVGVPAPANLDNQGIEPRVSCPPHHRPDAFGVHERVSHDP